MPFNADGSVTFTAEEFNSFKLALSFMLFAAGKAPAPSLDSALASVEGTINAVFDAGGIVGTSSLPN